jgi:hypothetical protein
MYILKGTAPYCRFLSCFDCFSVLWTPFPIYHPQSYVLTSIDDITEVLRAMVIKSSIFWDATTYSLLKAKWRFRGTYYLHLQDRSMSQAGRRNETDNKQCSDISSKICAIKFLWSRAFKIIKSSEWDDKSTSVVWNALEFINHHLTWRSRLVGGPSGYGQKSQNSISKKQKLANCLLLVSCLAYSLTLMMETTGSFNGLSTDCTALIPEDRKNSSVVLVRKRTIPTERPQPVGEVSANFSW